MNKKNKNEKSFRLPTLKNNFKANSIRPIFKCRILKQTILKPFNGSYPKNIDFIVFSRNYTHKKIGDNALLWIK